MAEASKTEDQDQPKKKSKLILLIIVGVGVCLLAGGGFMAYKKFFGHKASSTEAGAEAGGGHGAEAEAERGGGDRKKLPEVIAEVLPMDPFVVNLSDPKAKRYLKLKIEIEIETPAGKERATKATPKLRDAVIMMLTSLTFDEVMSPEGKFRIRDELLERFTQVLKPEKVKNIYFTEFVVQ